MAEITPRQAAEAIEELGCDLIARLKRFDKLAVPPDPMQAFNAIAHVEHLDTIASAILALGYQLCEACDRAEEADDRRRDNPLEPDYRRLAR